MIFASAGNHGIGKLGNRIPTRSLSQFLRSGFHSSKFASSFLMEDVVCLKSVFFPAAIAFEQKVFEL